MYSALLVLLYVLIAMLSVHITHYENNTTVTTAQKLSGESAYVQRNTGAVGQRTRVYFLGFRHLLLCERSTSTTVQTGEA
jgi:hypothetical protein